MRITEYIKDHPLYLDGGTGTMLQAAGLAPGELPERWCITHPDIVTGVHRAYYEAGSHVVSANTFGANLLHYTPDELEEVIRAAMDCVKTARAQSGGAHPKWVAADIGPTGRLLAPYGDFDFEEAVEVFAATVRLAEKYGAELLFIQTMNDSYETKAALLAAKENSSLPVFVANAYGEDGKLMTGATPAAMVAMLEGMGADAVGVNCSLGPRALDGVVAEYLRTASVPVLVKPNAGLPRAQDGKTVYDLPAEEFAAAVADQMRRGVRIAGGCCGTTPAYIAALTAASAGVTPPPLTEKNRTCVSSYTHAVEFGDRAVLIGERINPTGKKRLRQALAEEDMDYVLGEAISQQEKGVHVLDVNVGVPELDEKHLLQRVVCELQAVVDLPLQIDTANPAAMEAALRRYNGKALLNSVNGKEESMAAVFPLAKKYGGVVIALTLDETGIPATADGRVAIARRILERAADYGIAAKDIVFDPLAMTVSTDPQAARETLAAVRRIRQELGCHTSLGVSNVSFGLPAREAVNSTFFAMALENGLSAAIMNPNAVDMLKTYYAFTALNGQDPHCEDYVAFAGSLPAPAAAASAVSTAPAAEQEGLSPLQRAVVKGLREQAARLTAELLETTPPMDVVEREIIPALNRVGDGFENKTVYLPQLLMSAEAAGAAAEQIKVHMTTVGGSAATGCRVVLATVQGDIHDIGKNIVKLLLENYGFAVTDLGKDVSPETVAEKVVELGAPLVGLSALMTTTVPAMEETIRLMRRRAPDCRIVVGGAVLNKEYAAAIGADRYAADAMETVRYAQEVQALQKS
ncbi:MAG: homocysteine S-methyltransferase family protein [Clostridia bacterium]|nr:homocysteine S-methyltransferase family protein [Clostridia bacterium]